jgi:hypothetical protein
MPLSARSVVPSGGLTVGASCACCAATGSRWCRRGDRASQSVQDRYDPRVVLDEEVLVC